MSQVKLISAMITMALFLCSTVALAAETDYPDPRRVFRWDRQERLLGFKSVENLTAVHTVAAGGPVRELQPAAGDKEKKMAEALAGPTAAFLKTGDVVGVLVLHRGRVLVEEYAKGFTPKDRWTSFSVAKSVTSTLVGAAVSDGLLKLDDQVIKYVPELQGSAYDGVTVRHLLTMTSGVQWNEDYSDPDSDTARLALGAGGGDCDPLDDLRALPREAEPGTYFHYKTGESNLLGLVVSRAAGRSLAEYLSEKIWKPFGMETEAYWAVDGNGRELAGCCLSMTLRDYARFGQFMLDDEQAGGARVLPEGWVKEATTDISGQGYGYQWWLINNDIYAANGIFGQMIAIDRRTGSVAVMLSAWDGPVSSVGNKQRFQYLFEVGAAIIKNGGRRP